MAATLGLTLLCCYKRFKRHCNVSRGDGKLGSRQGSSPNLVLTTWKLIAGLHGGCGFIVASCGLMHTCFMVYHYVRGVVSRNSSPHFVLSPTVYQPTASACFLNAFGDCTKWSLNAAHTRPNTWGSPSYTLEMTRSLSFGVLFWHSKIIPSPKRPKLIPGKSFIFVAYFPGLQVCSSFFFLCLHHSQASAPVTSGSLGCSNLFSTDAAPRNYSKLHIRFVIIKAAPIVYWELYLIFSSVGVAVAKQISIPRSQPSPQTVLISTSTLIAQPHQIKTNTRSGKYWHVWNVVRRIDSIGSYIRSLHMHFVSDLRCLKENAWCMLFATIFTIKIQFSIIKN